MNRYEYFILKGAFSIKSNIQLLEDDFNELGAQGWEIASMTGDPIKSVYIVMRRDL